MLPPRWRVRDGGRRRARNIVETEDHGRTDSAWSGGRRVTNTRVRLQSTALQLSALTRRKGGARGRARGRALARELKRVHGPTHTLSLHGAEPGGGTCTTRSSRHVTRCVCAGLEREHTLP
eukprot:2752420-Rhodomonas_salina.1